MQGKSSEMGDRFNTVAGWALFAGIIALGGAIVSSKYFHDERPEPMGYAIEGVEAEGEGAASGPGLNTLLASADVAAGEKVFAKCAACHTITSGGANGIGPNLYATVGEEIGKGKAGFAFSAALSGKGGSWTFENLDHWLKSPREFAPGTKMTFAGLGNPVDRANLIAWMNTQGSNLPLPAADAAPAAEGANAAEAEAGNAANASEAPAANAAE
ncbi:cytochrome c [Sphingobium xenophagum]|jgi:cytochrome c|uniref:Cytochrome c n=2 Tax=Sphingomonadaceae TaxID=41297 RepID=A0A401IXP0_SPHXE|nr:cytochrome c [Sphingobium xenophagum]